MGLVSNIILGVSSVVGWYLLIDLLLLNTRYVAFVIQVSITVICFSVMAFTIGKAYGRLELSREFEAREKLKLTQKKE